MKLIILFSLIYCCNLCLIGNVEQYNEHFEQLSLYNSSICIENDSLVITNNNKSIDVQLITIYPINYQPIINTIRNLTRFDDLTKSFMILIPFGIGVLVGIVLIAKLIEFLLEKYEVKTYFGILGFVLASVLTLIYGLFGNSFDIVQILIGVVTFFIGSIVAYKLGDE